MTELLLGVNLTAYCITSLIVGNLGDRYGRRPIIILGLLIFNLGSLFCVFANNYAVILFGRFLQGCGISSVAVLVYVVLADIYSVQEQQRLMGILNGTIALSMAIAPVISSYVNLFWGWRSNFVLLLIVGLISLMLGILFIPKEKLIKNTYFFKRIYTYLQIAKSYILYTYNDISCPRILDIYWDCSYFIYARSRCNFRTFRTLSRSNGGSILNYELFKRLLL